MKKEINKNPLIEIIEDKSKLQEKADKYGEDALIESINYFIGIDYQAKRTSTLAAFHGGLRLIIYRETSGYFRSKEWAAHARIIFPDLSDKKRQNWMKLASNLRGFLFPTIFFIAQRNLLKLIRFCDEPRIDDYLAKYNISTDFASKDTARGRQLAQDVRKLITILEEENNNEKPSTDKASPSPSPSKRALSWNDIQPIDLEKIDPAIRPDQEDYIDIIEFEGFAKAVDLINWLEEHLPSDGYYQSQYLMTSFFDLSLFLQTLIQRFNSVHGKRHQFIAKEAKNSLYTNLN
ncbi:hypothetical protein [Desulfogranum marinum]|uniref:hypothetical protein n=1 Tax=Desulfogranum marinum TaxID=453220 RepID=UPI001965B789|nr:hypothetical protein [Desulfogranum marinum]MBM9515260.1 hypothetical protein [Desulfogranum marinum]